MPGSKNMDQQSVNRSKLTRRGFLSTAGGATFLVVGVSVLPGVKWEENEEDQRNVTAWIKLDKDGKVIIYNPSSEMGQGTMTATAVLLAEELDVDWDQVKVEHSPIVPQVYGKSWGGGRSAGGSMVTVGSSSIRGYYNILRVAGAQARFVLLYSVAKEWKVPLKELTTDSGNVIHAPSKRTITYGKVTGFIQQPDHLPEFPDDELKSVGSFKYVGKSLPRVDIGDKSNGTAVFAGDKVLPGMVYGVISRSPVHGSKPTLRNEEIIREMKGVMEIVPMDHGIGVIASTILDALNARKKMDISWSKGAKGASHNSEKAFEEYRSVNNSSHSIRDSGNIKEAFAEGTKIYQSDYLNDYVYHAQMEPLNAVISVSSDGKSAEAWVGSQAHDGARRTIAQVLGIDQEDVEYHPCYLGGGLGRRSMQDYVEEAAILAKVIMKPLKLMWTREDDLQYGAFRPISLQRMKASINNKGELTGWSHHTIGTGDGLLTSGVDIPYYSIPNISIGRTNIDHGIRTKHWRAVGHGPNKFAIEGFVDEIAKDLKVDELEFRMNLMRDAPRALAVLQRVAKMSDWGKNERGKAKGLAVAERSGSLSAGVIEVSVDKGSGKIKVHRIWIALDSGIVVQPDNAIAQCEGAIMMGLSCALKERITIREGKVIQSNFHNYQLLRMEEAPEEINVEFIDSSEPPAGVGEAALPMVGGALVNAFATLTGKRLRHMPFTTEKVLEVLNT